MTSLTAAVFNIAFGEGTEQVNGFIVPDTDNTLAVHERWVDHWRVTHTPSGRAVMPPHEAELSVREQAIGFARRFYAEAIKLGADLKSPDFDAVRKQMWEQLGIGEREAFWGRVL